MMMRTGRVGHCWAEAGAAAKPNTSASDARMWHERRAKAMPVRAPKTETDWPDADTEAFINGLPGLFESG